MLNTCNHYELRPKHPPLKIHHPHKRPFNSKNHPKLFLSTIIFVSDLSEVNFVTTTCFLPHYFWIMEIWRAAPQWHNLEYKGFGVTLSTLRGVVTPYEGFHPSLIKVVPPVYSPAACCPAMALSITLPRQQVRGHIQPRCSATGSAMYYH